MTISARSVEGKCAAGELPPEKETLQHKKVYLRDKTMTKYIYGLVEIILSGIHRLLTNI